VEGADLCATVRPRREAGFGFSEFPAVPCLVRVIGVFEPPR
jgi:hypothetical protein